MTSTRVATPEPRLRLVGRIADRGDHLDEQRQVLEAEVGAQVAGVLRALRQLGDERLDPGPRGREPLLAAGRDEQRLLEAAIFGVQLERLLEEAREAGPGVVGTEGLAGQRLDSRRLLVEELVDQRLPVREAAIDGPDADAGVPGDVVEPDVDAALGEQHRRGREDPLPVPLRVPAKRPRRHGRLRCVRHAMIVSGKRRVASASTTEFGSGKGGLEARRRRRDRLRDGSGAVGARDRRARLRDRLPRRHGRKRRAAADRRGLRCPDELTAVDPQRLHADPGLADPARRLARRSVRPAADLRRRRPLVHRRLAALCDRPERRRADRRPPASGRRRRPADARQPGDDRVELPARRPRPRDRRLVRPRRRRDRPRAAARRLARRGGLVAGDLPDQRPDRRLRGADGNPPRPRDPRPQRARASRRPRLGPGRRRPRGDDLRADRSARCGLLAGDRSCRDSRRRRAGRVHRPGAPQRPSDDAARALLLAAVQRRQRGHVRRLRRPQRRLLPARRLPPDRRRLLADRGRRRLAPGDGADAALLSPRGRPRAADRRPGPADRGTARDRRRNGDDGPDRPRRRLRDVGPAVRDRLRRSA